MFRPQSCLDALSLQEEEAFWQLLHRQEGAKAQPQVGAGEFWGCFPQVCACGRAGGEPRGREKLFLKEIKQKAATELRGEGKKKYKTPNPTEKPPADLIWAGQECPNLELPSLSSHPNHPWGASTAWSSLQGVGRRCGRGEKGGSKGLILGDAVGGEGKGGSKGLILDLPVPGEKLREFGAPPAPPSGNCPAAAAVWGISEGRESRNSSWWSF